MNRRFFLLSGLASSALFAFTKKADAEPASGDAAKNICLMKMDEITAEATGFTRYEHFHQLSVPIAVLINPPKEGFKIRCSTLDQGSLDEKAFNEFIKETGLDPSLRFHSHEVKFTQDELNRIASGEKDVKITVLSPKGNFAHDFTFTAPRSAIVKIQRGRAKKG